MSPRRRKAPREPFKIGRRRFGDIVNHADGRRTLLLERSRSAIWRGKHFCISHAVDTGDAAWPVETLFLSKMKAREVDFIAIRVREDKALYIAPLVAFLEHSRMLTNRRRNGSSLRYLGFEHFAHRPGVEKI